MELLTSLEVLVDAYDPDGNVPEALWSRCLGTVRRPISSRFDAVCAGARAWLKPFPMASYGVVALWPPTFCHMLIWTSA